MEDRKPTERQMVRKSIKAIMLPEFLAAGYHHVPLAGEDLKYNETKSHNPYGRYTKVRSFGWSMIVPDFRYPWGRPEFRIFAINIEEAKFERRETFNETYIEPGDIWYNEYGHDHIELMDKGIFGKRQFKLRWIETQSVTQTHYDALIRRMCNLMQQVYDYLDSGKIGPNIKVYEPIYMSQLRK